MSAGEVSRTGAKDRELTTCFRNCIHSSKAESSIGSAKILRLSGLNFQSHPTGKSVARRLSLRHSQASRLGGSAKAEQHEQPYTCRTSVAREAHRELDSLRPACRGADSR